MVNILNRKYTNRIINYLVKVSHVSLGKISFQSIFIYPYIYILKLTYI